MKANIVKGSLGFLLLAPYASILLHAVYCYFLVGHWPSYNNPDPKNLPSILGLAASILWLAALVSIALYPLTSLFLKALRKTDANRQERVFSWHLGVFLAGLFFWVLDIQYIHLISWELD